MSDASAVQTSSAVRRALEVVGRIFGTHSASEPAAASSSPSAVAVAGSPAASHSGSGEVSRLGTPSLSADDAPTDDEGDAQWGTDGEVEERTDWSSSEASTEEVVPDAVLESEWSGLNNVRLPKCEHGKHAVLKKAWGGKHTGRRFLGCPLKSESKQCQLVDWLDDPWNGRVQKAMKKIWKELLLTRRAEAVANNALHEALVSYYDNKDIEDDLKAALEEARVAAAKEERKVKLLLSFMLGLFMCFFAAVIYKYQ